MPEFTIFSPLGRRRLALNIAFRRHPYDDDRAMRLAPQLVDFLFQEIGEQDLERMTESTILPADMADILAEGDFQEALGFDAQEVGPDVADTMPQAGPETQEEGSLIQQEGGEHGGAEALVEPLVDDRTEEAGAPEKAPCTENETAEIHEAGGAADAVPPATGVSEADAGARVKPAFLVPGTQAALVLEMLARRQRQGEAMPGNGEIDGTLGFHKNRGASAISYLCARGLLHREGVGQDRVLTVTPAGLATIDALTDGSRSDGEPLASTLSTDGGETPTENDFSRENGADENISKLPQLSAQPLKLLATIRRMTFAGVCTATNAYLAAASGCARGAAGRSVVVLRDAGVIDVDADSTRGRTIRITEKGRSLLAGASVEEASADGAVEPTGEVTSAVPGEDAGEADGADENEDDDLDDESLPPPARSTAKASDRMSEALARSGMRYEDDPRARRPEKVMCAIPTRPLGGGSGLADIVG